MNDRTEYTFYDGANTTIVNRKKEIITTYERGGWERDYSLTFKELLENAQHWDIKVDLNDPDQVIAEIATNIILANNAVYHGLDPFRFVPRTNKITDPRDLNVLTKFEKLLEKYTVEQVLAIISQEKKQVLKEQLMKD
jgi:hypothetical protein